MQDAERAYNSKKVGLFSSRKKKVIPKLRIVTKLFELPPHFSFAKKAGRWILFK
jgi:hypothetical protein